MKPTPDPFAIASPPGFALLAVLWCVLISGLILLGAQRFGQVNLAMAHNELNAVQARWLARAGIEQAIAVLADDLIGSDALSESWYEDNLYFREVQLGQGSFSVLAPPDRLSLDAMRYGVEDLAALVNVNTADEGSLNRLEILDLNQVAAILDWRDQDEQAHPGGAESAYYMRANFPYLIRNGPLQTLDELRLVRGIDDDTFFGPQDEPNRRLDAQYGMMNQGLASLATVHSYERNLDALDQPRINLKSTSAEVLQTLLNFTAPLAQAVMQKNSDLRTLVELVGTKGEGDEPPPSDDGLPTVHEITLQWLADNLDRLTLVDDERLPARLNINTAPPDALITLPSITAPLADAIIAFRESAGGPFFSVGELLNVSGITEEIFKEILEKVTVRSNVFRITSVGQTPSGITRQVIAIVDRGSTPAIILYWYESE